MLSKVDSDFTNMDFDCNSEHDHSETLHADQCWTNDNYTSPRVQHVNPKIIITQDHDAHRTSVKTPKKPQQRKRTRRNKKRGKRKQAEDDSRKGGAPKSAHSDSELPVLVSRNSADNIRPGRDCRDSDGDKPGSSLSLPPMPSAAPTRRPSGLAPLHNAPPPSFSFHSPRKMDRAQEPQHPFYKGHHFSDYKLKNIELGLSMFAAAKEKERRDFTEEGGEKSERRLSDGLRINFPALVGVGSSTSLIK